MQSTNIAYFLSMYPVKLQPQRHGAFETDCLKWLSLTTNK